MKLSDMKRLSLIALPQAVSAQSGGVREKIDALIAGKHLKAGIALCNLRTNDTPNTYGDDPLPMQSVFKFPIAPAALTEVDKGRRQQSGSHSISPQNLPAGTWSPIRERYPDADFYLTLAEVMRCVLAQSDNDSCDPVLRLPGASSCVNDYVGSPVQEDITIEKSKAEMHRDRQGQSPNQATPQAMTELLRLFESGQLLQRATPQFLRKTMAATSAGSGHTKLPPEAVTIHKTETSDRNAEGNPAATNNAGTLIRPDRGHIAYSIFITGSAEPDAVNHGIIPDPARIPHTLLYLFTP